MDNNLYNVGKIINTHGIHGEVKILRITDFDDRFEVGQIVYLVKDDAPPLKLTIDGHRIHKGFDLIHFSGYNNINDVEQFKNAFLKISEEQLTELDEGEFYYHEIIGCTVYTNKGYTEKLGVVKEILSPGANDVWVVQREKGKDVLIPYIDEVVKEIDVMEKKIVIEPLEGLLD